MTKAIPSILPRLKDCNTVFCRYADIINGSLYTKEQTCKLWSKELIREIGLDLRIDELFLIRQESEVFLAEKKHLLTSELSYKNIAEEIYNRLSCTGHIQNVLFEGFLTFSENAELSALKLTRTLNVDFINALKKLKEDGYTIHCIKENNLTRTLINGQLNYYGISELFGGVLAKSEINPETENTSYSQVLDKVAKLDINQVLVIDGENQNSPNFSFKTIQTKESHKEIDNDNEQEKYRKVVRKLYKDCNNKSAPPHSDYILFYYVYIERLYKKAKKDKLKNIFFLAREGLFLKKLFDYYQNEVGINPEHKIASHYFKASRNSLMLASLKTLDKEEFSYLRRRWPDLSVDSFLNNFHFTADLKMKIAEDAGLLKDYNKVISNFLDSEIFKNLLQNPLFIREYNTTRTNQKEYFNSYLKSFNVDIKTEGFHLSDVGWGGTMQNRLYDFFEEKIEVHGYYLGVREINNIRKRTIKHGLNFSVYPYVDFFDHILMANVELNEQLLAAGHGSTLAYTNDPDSRTIEHHEENDKRVYDAYIEDTQNHMFERFKELTKSFKLICYDHHLEQYEMMDHALRIGLFASKRKVKRENDIYKGFYQNVGNFSVGLAIGENFSKKEKLNLLSTFLLKPEEAFRYVLRLKPMLLRRKKYLFAYLIPSTLIYYYIKLRYRRNSLSPKVEIF